MLYFLLAHPTPTGFDLFFFFFCFFPDLADCEQATFKKLYDMNFIPRKLSEVPKAKIELIELRNKK